jgi:hypothetical protein
MLLIRLRFFEDPKIFQIMEDELAKHELLFEERFSGLARNERGDWHFKGRK